MPPFIQILDSASLFHVSFFTLLVAACQPPECPEPVAAPVIERTLEPATSAAPPGATPAVTVDLPKSSEFDPTQAIVVVTVTADGNFYVAASRRTPEEVVAFAKEAAAKDPETRVAIAADRGVPYSRVIYVIDLLKQGGISKIALAVSPKD